MNVRPSSYIRGYDSNDDTSVFEGYPKWVSPPAPPEGWGDVDVRVGSFSPWGAIDHLDVIGEGIVVVGTPSHGGVRLSPARNRGVPKEMRIAEGWYEEDCAAEIVVATYPDEPGWWPRDVSAEEHYVQAVSSLRKWFPDQWEKVSGETIQSGVSPLRDRELHEKEHARDLLVRSAVLSDEAPGMVEATASIPGDSATRTFLIPKEEYDTRGKNSLVVADPEKYEETTDEPGEWSWDEPLSGPKSALRM